jgi:hypothetical protein
MSAHTPAPLAHDHDHHRHPRAFSGQAVPTMHRQESVRAQTLLGLSAAARVGAAAAAVAVLWLLFRWAVT